jgi:ABC-2 type transport system permease protein
VRLALRRDRIIVPVFIAVVVSMVVSGASATLALYTDAASRIEASTLINTATSTLAMYGPIHDPESIGALSVFKLGMMGVLAVAVFGARIVVRHTRAEEETGRLELLGAAVVGRRAPLTAALIVSAAAGVIAGALSGLGLYGVGLPGGGSAIFGAGMAVVGVLGAALGAVAAQLTTSARAAAGMATGAVAVAFVTRAAADASSGHALAWLSWCSPLGWWQQLRPYAGDRVWPLALLLGLAAVLLVAAYALTARRDFAGGLLAERAGRAAGARSLNGPLGLAWRLQRNAFGIWALTFAVTGALIGGLSSSVGDFLDNPGARELFEKFGGAPRLSDAFLSVELAFLGVAVSIFGLQAVLRARSEEVGLRAEPMLANATTRVRWLGSHLVVALTGSVALLAILGVAAGLTSAASVDTANQFWRVVGAALVQVPAVFVMIGIGIAGFGISGRLAVAGWAALAAFVVLGEFGVLLSLPQWIINLAPFAHTPRLPGVTLSWTPVVWLTAVAAALIVVGLASFRRRDLD